MEKNKKILKIGLILIGIVLVINIGFAIFIKLDNPVFLKSYNENIAYLVPEEEAFNEIGYQIYYITNVDDKRRVSDITFKEAPEIEVYAGENLGFHGLFNPIFGGDSYNDEIYGRYVLRQVYIRLDLNNLDKDFNSIELNNAKINFDNGDILEQDLGRLIIYNEKEKSNSLEFLGAGSSSDGTSHVDIDIKEDITLVEMESPLLKDIEDIIEIKVGKNNGHGIDYRKIEGIEYKKGDKLIIDSKLTMEKDNAKSFNYYNIVPLLYFKDKDGNLSRVQVFNLIDHYNRNYDYNFKGFFNYLRAKGEI